MTPRMVPIPTFSDKLVARVGRLGLVRLFVEGPHAIYGQLAWADESEVCLIWTGGPELVPVHRICSYRVADANDAQRMSDAAVEAGLEAAEKMRAPLERVVDHADHEKAMAELELAFGRRDWAACHEVVQYMDALFANMEDE
ncbi:MAG: hypothetical protein KJO40_19565 [Deltaproteobacteria bacterium]|nr:hypothetical protein [Deltaproteobacteria bacterium]